MDQPLLGFSWAYSATVTLWSCDEQSQGCGVCIFILLERVGTVREQADAQEWSI